MVLLILGIAMVVGYRWRGWRGVALVGGTFLGVWLLATFVLLFFGGQVSTILVEP